MKDLTLEEVRVGNYLLHKGNEYTVLKTHFITPSKVIYSDRIQLTEKHLLKFGFNAKSIEHNFILNEVEIYCIFRHMITNERDGFYLLFNNGKDLGIKIDFVHQLQNIYFALTNEELKY